MGIFSDIGKYFGVGEKGLGQFGQDVNNTINTAKNAANTAKTAVSLFGVLKPKTNLVDDTKNALNSAKKVVNLATTANAIKTVVEPKKINPVQDYVDSTINFTKKTIQDIPKIPEQLSQLESDPKKAREAITKAAFISSTEPLKNVSEDVVTKGKGIFSSLVKKISSTDDQVPQASSKFTQPEGGVLSSLESKDNFEPLTYVKELTQNQKNAEKPSIKQNLTDKVSSFYNDLKTKLVDSNAPIEDALRDAQKKYNFEVLPKADITPQIDKVLRSPTLAGQFAKDKGIVDVIKNVDNLDNLDQYLIAKQAKDVSAKGVKTGRDLIKDQQLIDTFAPQYEEAAQKINQYSRDLLDYSVDSGLISKELAEKLKTEYPHYVPLNRVFSELEKGQEFTGTKAVASLSRQTVVQKIKGSTREIESPVASLLAKTNDAFKQGEKNKAARILASYENLPGFENLIKKLPEGETALHTFSYLENGVKKTFATTKEIEQAAKNLNDQQLSILGKIISFPVRLAKAGITGLNLPFVFSNIAKDQIFGMVTAKNSKTIANPSVFLKALSSAVKHDELYDELVRSGGGGTSFDIARDQAKQTIEKIRSNRSIGAKIKYIAKNPSELLRSVEDIIGRGEELTRIQQYAGTKKALLKQGRIAEDANIIAAKAARENTANFSRRGEWGKVLNSTFLYLNAGIQGSRSLVRSFARDPKGTAAKVATVLYLPVAATTAWNVSDETRKQAYADIPDYEKENNLIIIPPNPKKDEKGQWNIIKIPLPPGLSSLAIPVRKGLEQMYGLDPIKFTDVAKALYGPVDPLNFDLKRPEAILSSITPQAIKPTLEAVTNRNFFTGLPQVSASKEKLSPELQVKPDTSGTARLIGKTIDKSPIKVQEFIKGTAGGLGLLALNLSDRILAGFDIIPKDQVGGQGVLDAIAFRFSKARGGESGKIQTEELYDLLQKQDDDRFRIKQAAELLYDELKVLPKDEANAKARKIKEVQPEIFKKLKEVVEDAKTGLTYDDRLLKQLGVENGARAKFIFSKTQEMKTKEEKNLYIKDLKNKGIISDNVLEQLKNLIAKSKS